VVAIADVLGRISGALVLVLLGVSTGVGDGAVGAARVAVGTVGLSDATSAGSADPSAAHAVVTANNPIATSATAVPEARRRAAAWHRMPL
jgi:hypothetical protein